MMFEAFDRNLPPMPDERESPRPLPLAIKDDQEFNYELLLISSILIASLFFTLLTLQPHSRLPDSLPTKTRKQRIFGMLSRNAGLIHILALLSGLYTMLAGTLPQQNSNSMQKASIFTFRKSQLRHITASERLKGIMLLSAERTKSSTPNSVMPSHENRSFKWLSKPSTTRPVPTALSQRSLFSVPIHE